MADDIYVKKPKKSDEPNRHLHDKNAGVIMFEYQF